MMILDKRSLRKSFDRAATDYDGSAILQREVANRLLERLDFIRDIPQQVVDVGCGTGYCTRALAKRYPKARIYGLDLARAMVEAARKASPWFFRTRSTSSFICGDADAMPLADNSVDMVFSNLTLQWCDAERAFREFYRILRPGGLLMFTTFGPDTLKELRQAWSEVDEGTHVHEFVDMHELGDLLVKTRFADPVMDMEMITVTYPDVTTVMKDLKSIGAHNAAVGRRRALTGKERFKRFQAGYTAMAQNHRIPVTHETVYGHAWVPMRKPTGDGIVRVPIERIGRRG